MQDAYFCWLVGLIGDDYIRVNYQRLLWKLYITDYIWELDYDSNRAYDGLLLRDEYVRCGGYFSGVVVKNGVCSVLEMFIALARAAENNIMHDPDFGDRTGKWFWIMLQNLGLDVYDDYHWFESEVERILDIFLHHRYEKNGLGGAFPVHNRTRDLRKMDLWWQMNAYLEEHFPA